MRARPVIRKFGFTPLTRRLDDDYAVGVMEGRPHRAERRAFAPSSDLGRTGDTVSLLPYETL